MDRLDTEAVDKFEYVRYCWSEAMRLQPPVAGSSISHFQQSVIINGTKFDKDTLFTVNMQAIQTDPAEW